LKVITRKMLSDKLLHSKKLGAGDRRGRYLSHGRSRPTGHGLMEPGGGRVLLANPVPVERFPRKVGPIGVGDKYR
jgi:hypothetical protein